MCMTFIKYKPRKSIFWTCELLNIWPLGPNSQKFLSSMLKCYYLRVTYEKSSVLREVTECAMLKHSQLCKNRWGNGVMKYINILTILITFHTLSRYYDVCATTYFCCIKFQVILIRFRELWSLWRDKAHITVFPAQRAPHTKVHLSLREHFSARNFK